MPQSQRPKNPDNLAATISNILDVLEAFEARLSRLEDHKPERRLQQELKKLISLWMLKYPAGDARNQVAIQCAADVVTLLDFDSGAPDNPNASDHAPTRNQPLG
jgi:hypothetical protein